MGKEVQKTTRSGRDRAGVLADFCALSGNSILFSLRTLRLCGEFVLQFNDALAITCTRAFGTMWVFYLFFLFGFVPVLWPAKMSELLYWSNTVQLWALPLLMVGQHLLGRASERRAQETHDAVMEEIKLLRTICQKVAPPSTAAH